MGIHSIEEKLHWIPCGGEGNPRSRLTFQLVLNDIGLDEALRVEALEVTESDSRQTVDPALQGLLDNLVKAYKWPKYEGLPTQMIDERHYVLVASPFPPNPILDEEDD